MTAPETSGLSKSSTPHPLLPDRPPYAPVGPPPPHSALIVLTWAPVANLHSVSVVVEILRLWGAVLCMQREWKIVGPFYNHALSVCQEFKLVECAPGVCVERAHLCDSYCIVFTVFSRIVFGIGWLHVGVVCRTQATHSALKCSPLNQRINQTP